MLKSLTVLSAAFALAIALNLIGNHEGTPTAQALPWCHASPTPDATKNYDFDCEDDIDVLTFQEPPNKLECDRYTVRVSITLCEPIPWDPDFIKLEHYNSGWNELNTTAVYQTQEGGTEIVGVVIQAYCDEYLNPANLFHAKLTDGVIDDATVEFFCCVACG